MKIFFFYTGVSIILLLKDVGNIQAATFRCSHSTATAESKDRQVAAINGLDDTTNKNSFNKLFQNIQCTLEKAKPWVTELQQEAKRLEEAAKLLGLGILNSFGEFVDKLVNETAVTSSDTPSNSMAAEGNAGNSTALVVEELSQYLCPEGFIADHNGICERVD